MELTLWTYEGPPHVGAIRVAASMRDVHLMLHSPQGDTYAMESTQQQQASTAPL